MTYKTIIVNADDLGTSPEVNNAVSDFMSRRRVTSATILANGAAVEDAARLSREFPDVSFGVHLNASDSLPLAPTSGLSEILSTEGRFAGNRLRETPIGRGLRAALFVEWSAQIQRLLDLGVRVSHMDSHYHMHTVPGAFPVILQLQRRFGIRRVRISMNIYSSVHRPREKALLFKKAIWNAALRLSGATTTEGFTSLEVFCQSAPVKPMRFNTIELMVHPGNPIYTEEAAILASPWEATLPFPIRLANYWELRS